LGTVVVTAVIGEDTAFVELGFFLLLLGTVVVTGVIGEDTAFVELGFFISQQVGHQ
jgi:hypothetical protein